MSDTALTACPRCGTALEAGFAAQAIGLSFGAPENFERFAFLDEDLAKSGLRKLLPSKAEYFRSYLCRSCELYLIDFGTTLDRRQAEQVARSLTGKWERRKLGLIEAAARLALGCLEATNGRAPFSRVSRCRSLDGRWSFAIPGRR